MLKASLRTSTSDFMKLKEEATPEDVKSIKEFLASRSLRSCAAFWKRLCGADPPRPVLHRCAKKFGVSLHMRHRYWNYTSKKDFLHEIKRMSRWYSMPWQTTRRRHGLSRVRASTSLQVKGQKTVWTAKLRQHYRRLRNRCRLRGLMRWRTCALALHKAGLPLQSGTVPVERHWAAFKSYFPAAQKTLKPDTFALLAALSYLRFNWSHFNKQSVPNWTQKDVLLAHKATDFLKWIRHEGRQDDLHLLQAELNDLWRKQTSRDVFP